MTSPQHPLGIQHIREYRSIGDLNERIVDWLEHLPRDLDLIVGIPRSGVLPASLLGRHLNLPAVSLDELVSGAHPDAGRARQDAAARGYHVFVVDDSACSGSTLRKVRETISAAGLPHRVSYGAVFVSPEAVERRDADYFAEIVPEPRVFEWNVMHSPRLAKACVDIDGVLCHNPQKDDNDDGVRYLSHLRSASPLCLPTHEIGWLVTARLEKYRGETETWLALHGVKYRELIMRQEPDRAARRAGESNSVYKANVYIRTGASLFIESSRGLAAGIARYSGYPVFCMESRELLWPGDRAREAFVYGSSRNGSAGQSGNRVRLRLKSITRRGRSFEQRARTVLFRSLASIEERVNIAPRRYKGPASTVYRAIGKWDVDAYQHPPNPLELRFVDPEDVKLITGRDYKAWANRRRLLGSVKSGDWDIRQPRNVPIEAQPYPREFEEYSLFKAFRERFVDGLDWQDTQRYRAQLEMARAQGSESLERLLKKLSGYDLLYEGIKNHGYKTQFELGDRRTLLRCLFNEIAVDIGRDGAILFVDGRHRLSIAKLLGIKKVPVCVLVRHQQWMEYRDAMFLAGQESDHPDF
ncbi:hypothetical protein BH23GEM6_BH23GEM6_18000 [soil metagenome]